MSVFELAELENLHRLVLVRVPKLTDNAIYHLGDHARSLERLHLSYCDRISLKAIHHLLRRAARLNHLTATGVPAARRMGLSRFSDRAPEVSGDSDCDCGADGDDCSRWTGAKRRHFGCSAGRISGHCVDFWTRRSCVGNRLRRRTYRLSRDLMTRRTCIDNRFELWLYSDVSKGLRSGSDRCSGRAILFLLRKVSLLRGWWL